MKGYRSNELTVGACLQGCQELMEDQHERVSLLVIDQRYKVYENKMIKTD